MGDIVRGGAMLFWSAKQASLCAAAYGRFGLATFLLVLFFCLLANHLAVAWWRHG